MKNQKPRVLFRLEDGLKHNLALGWVGQFMAPRVLFRLEDGLKRLQRVVAVEQRGT